MDLYHVYFIVCTWWYSVMNTVKYNLFLFSGHQQSLLLVVQLNIFLKVTLITDDNGMHIKVMIMQL